MGKKFKKKFNNFQKKPYHKNKRFQKRNNDDPPTDHHNLENETAVIVRKDNLKEDQVGISEYVNRGEGFKAIIKSRFSDFHVNEIDINGFTLHLTDLTIPEEKEEELPAAEISSAMELLKDVVSDDMWKQIEDLKESKLEQNKKLKDHYIDFDVSEMNREQRTKFHKIIGTMYKNKLATTTMRGDVEKKFIRVMRSNGPGRNHWTFPGDFVHFLVHKENLDTSDAASTIASKLRLKPSMVNYCGTKDKRAKTTQRFCIKKRTPRQIAGAVKYTNGITIGNFEFRKKYLKLGDLRGNRFRIALRNLVGDRKHIEASLNNVKEQGFINYFGFQRFGNCSSIPTYDVGIALLKANYKLACELILKPRDNDVPFLKKIREMWWKNRDSKAAAAEFYGDRFIEKKLLDGLAQYGENDYAAALMKIPRNMLLLYPHAFQSLIFNYVASKRIKEFGLSVLPGDLVYIHREELYEQYLARQKDKKEQGDGGNDRNQEDAENDGNQDDEKNEEDQDEEKEFADMSEDEEFIEDKDTDPENPPPIRRRDRERFIFKRKVKFLTQEEITSGKYDIQDVLLTLPGHDIRYPDNVIDSYYKEFMENYDLSSEKLKHNLKLFTMKGAYRKLIVKPRDMSWEFKSYSSPEETLILSDIEILQGKTLEDFKIPETEPTYEALLLDFCLPPAAYATMMLRELLKCDTSAAAQSILQKEADKERAEANDGEKDTLGSEASCEKLKAIKKENEDVNDEEQDASKSDAAFENLLAIKEENEDVNDAEEDASISEASCEKLEAIKKENEDLNYSEHDALKSDAVGEKRKARDSENEEESIQSAKLLKNQ